jgi:hypothetical protein
MSVYQAKTYRDYVRASLAGGEGGRRGAVKRLAEHLRCHSTYVSQVVSGKADLSVDQAMRFCGYCELPSDQTEYFLDLLQRDRAGTKEARAHFQTRIDRRLAELSDMKKRWQIAETLTAEQELKYYANWIPQAVHLYCQLPGSHTVESIAQALGLGTDKITKVIADLESLGYLGNGPRGWRSLRDTVHLGKDSEITARSHVHWRLKTIAELTERSRLPGTHYSSVITMNDKAAREIDALILQHIDATRSVILPAPSESLYVYCLDFYPLLQRR